MDDNLAPVGCLIAFITEPGYGTRTQEGFNLGVAQSLKTKVVAAFALNHGHVPHLFGGQRGSQAGHFVGSYIHTGFILHGPSKVQLWLGKEPGRIQVFALAWQQFNGAVRARQSGKHLQMTEVRHRFHTSLSNCILSVTSK